MALEHRAPKAPSIQHEYSLNAMNGKRATNANENVTGKPGDLNDFYLDIPWAWERLQRASEW